MSGIHSEKFETLSKDLLLWYAQNGREYLPWRQTGLTPYHIWISEIMLQQTQVSRVIPYFERFLQRFPTVEILAASSWEEFLPFYQGLGYYARGRNMLKTAQVVVEKFGGVFPATIAELRTLPGVGPYTAAAILSFGSGYPHLAFDTNHQRVWGRVLHGSKVGPVEATEIESILPSQLPYKDFNAAVMDLASEICTNRSPRCTECPLKTHCVYFAESGASEPTASSKRSNFPTNEAQTILVLHEKHKKYFSSQQDTFTPFILPKPIVSRDQIKSYFVRKFNLNVSVRPPQWQGTWNDQPTQIVFAQVLAGDVTFRECSQDDWKNWRAKEEINLENARQE